MNHIWFKCKQPCDNPHCMFCEGGLGSCTVCEGFEGTLTRDCCGFKLDETDYDLIWKHGLQFTAEKGWHFDEEGGCGRRKKTLPPQAVLEAIKRLNLEQKEYEAIARIDQMFP